MDTDSLVDFNKLSQNESICSIYLLHLRGEVPTRVLQCTSFSFIIPFPLLRLLLPIDLSSVSVLNVHTGKTLCKSSSFFLQNFPLLELYTGQRHFGSNRIKLDWQKLLVAFS